ncbi:MAG: ABC transporter substrate-binding protein [Clostridia bacterium]|nr:ABC transporter substrate-binding protein [Clostridia bacterium]
MKKVLSVILSLTLLFAFCSFAEETAFVTEDGKCACGCGLDVSSYSPYIQELIYNAHVNNETLNVYGACDESYVKAAGYHFEELFKIPTTAMRFATGELFTKTQEEKDNPQADVWFGGSNDYYIKAKEAGLLASYQPENEKNLIVEEGLEKSRYIDPDYEWFGIYTGVLGIMVNIEEVEDLGYEAPTSWHDLLDPKWEGLVAIPNPETSATATNFLATMHYVYGYPDALDEEGLADFFKTFDKNVSQYTKSGSGPSKMVGPGECVIGISFLHDGVAQIANGYDNIQLVVPSEGSGFEVGACAIVKNDANPNASKLFIEYCLTADCVNMGKDYQSYQNLVITAEAGAVQPEELINWGLDDLSKCNLVPYDVVDVAPKLADWTKTWLEIIGGSDDRHKTS